MRTLYNDAKKLVFGSQALGVLVELEAWERHGLLKMRRQTKRLGNMPMPQVYSSGSSSKVQVALLLAQSSSDSRPAP